MHRVVIDTNVFVSSIIQRSGYPYKVVKAWEENRIILVTSPAIIEEVEKVLKYPKLKKYNFDITEIKRVVSNLTKYSELIEKVPAIEVIDDDPDDNKFLAVALEGEAAFIVSGDEDLLGLKEYKGIKILSPKQFCEVAGL